MSLYSYSTLYDLQRELTTDRTNRANIDRIDEQEKALLQAGREATAAIEEFVGYGFVPQEETRYYDARMGIGQLNYTRNTLSFNDFALEILELVTAEGSTRVLDTDYRALPRGGYPYRELYVINNAFSWRDYTNDWVEAISVKAKWGWHDRYGSAWVDSGDTVTQGSPPLSSTGTTLTVADADGANLNGFDPRFSEGQVIRIEDEYLVIISVDTGTNDITVARGQLGTTAAEHANGVSIYTYEPVLDISQACAKLAVYHYKTRGQNARVVINDMMATKEVTGVDPSVKRTLARYARKRDVPMFINGI